MPRTLKDAVEAHIRIPLNILNSAAFIALDPCAVKLYVDLRSRLRSMNNGDISAALSELKHRGWRSPVTLAKALRQLEATGLIAKTRKTVGVEHGSKVCNLYRFTDLPVFEKAAKFIPASSATREFRTLTTLRDAQKAVRDASPPRAKRALQNLQGIATETRAGVEKPVVVPFRRSAEV